MNFKISKFKTLAFVALSSIAPVKADIIINEVMPSNLSTYMDDLYNYSGWAEVYNSGTASVNLKGYTFEATSSDTVSEKATIDYDCNIPAGGYKLFFFDKITGVNNHFSFKMDADGGTLALLDADSKTVSSLAYGEMYSYISYGVNGTSKGYMQPTPGAANSNAYTGLSTARCAKPTFSTTPGLYDESKSVSTTLASTTSDTKIYYTTNGSEPTDKNGKLYTGEITMTKNTVIRARAYADGMLPSAITTGSYIFNDSQHSYCTGFTSPIVSLVTDSANFYDNKIGICVTGTNGVAGTKSCVSEKANFNQDWERPVNFEFIVDKKSAFSQEVEAKVMGGCSRQASYKVKSLKLGSSKKCGSDMNKMKYSFFPDRTYKKYKSVHLRNGGNAYPGLKFRDGFMQALIQKTGIDYQSYRPVAYYIDGVYQGFMGLRERMNHDYLWTHYDLDDDDIDLISISDETYAAEDGDVEAYESMIAAANSDPSSDSYYNTMNTLMDMNEYLDYMIFEQFIVNTDWPSNNNKIWRSRHNGRFRWLLYDTDFGFGYYGGAAPNYTSYTTDMIKFCKGEGEVINWGNGEDKGEYYAFTEATKWKTELFAQLMKNDEFRSKYLIRTLYHLATDLSTDKIKTVWDSISNDAYGEYCAANNPNQYWKLTYDKDDDATAILSFAEKRPAYVLQYLAEEFGGSAVNLNITSDNDDAQFIINGERWNQSSYVGSYVSNNKLTVTPVAPIGYKFDHWILSSSASGSVIDSKSQWRYYYNNDMPAKDWMSTKYDDAAWSEGTGLFGYGTSNTYTTALDYGDDASAKYVTAYFRTNFTLDKADQYSKLTASLTYDDGVVVYVNGKEVKRLNIADTTVDNNVLATTYVNDATATFDINDSLLVDGDNIIAVEVHQNSVSSSDMTFSMTINGIGYSSETKSTTPTYSANVVEDLEMKAYFTKCDVDIPLVINEICVSNKKEGGYADECGNYGDWIEIYNNGTESIDLAGMYISDNAKKKDKYQFPYTDEVNTVVAPGEHKLIWCDDETWNGALHTSFKLSMGTASPVILSYKSGDNIVTLDSITYGKDLGENQTYGRKVDASDSWTIFSYNEADGDSVLTFATTPGEANGSISTDIDAVLTNANYYVAVYPNPAHDVIYVKAKNEKASSIGIYDNLGRQLVAAKLTKEEQQINISNLTRGIYLMKIETSKGPKCIKFVKE